MSDEKCKGCGLESGRSKGVSGIPPLCSRCPVEPVDNEESYRKEIQASCSICGGRGSYVGGMNDSRLCPLCNGHGSISKKAVVEYEEALRVPDSDGERVESVMQVCKRESLRTQGMIEEDEDMKKLIYIASPYSSPSSSVRRYRYNKVVEYVAKLMLGGFHAFSPIIHNHPLLRFVPKGWEKWEYWKEYDLLMLSKCDAMVVLKLEGWENNVGVKAEIEEAKKIGMSIMYKEI